MSGTLSGIHLTPSTILEVNLDYHPCLKATGSMTKIQAVELWDQVPGRNPGSATS